jgi:N-acetylneuraminic acid mutarotase
MKTRIISVVAVAAATAVGALTTQPVLRAQDPTLRWVKASPFPVPEEELYGVSVNSKMYVIGGYGATGQPAPAMVWEYDPGPDKWTRKKNLPVAVHHQAQTVMNGKIYFFGGCQRPANGPGANGWAPVDNAWEYDPAADTYKALAPMPGKRCSAIAESVGGRIYVIGGVTTMDNTTDVAFNGQGPARVLGVNQVYDPAANTWTTKSAMPTGRNHAFSGVVNGKIYVIGGRIGHGFVTTSSNTDVVEEYDPARDLWGVAKARMISPRSGGGWATYNGKIYVAGGEVQNERYSAAFRSLETYDPVANRWDILPSLPGAVHGNAVAFIGNRLHTVSGKMEGGGFADAPGKATADHSVMEMHSAGTQ